ncbi:hypothetical protein AND_001710 [Anopheles darlingi]|uniref:Uncharacterized protein n=1 Tax=Anopheles darlingi TaxID=43151 RepID=W5JT95_ANODA|nr:hypothetical protein AND_001710 [Anopheles darlingi]
MGDWDAVVHSLYGLCGREGLLFQQEQRQDYKILLALQQRLKRCQHQ